MYATMISTLEDFEGWLRLAKEVEPLFGPMVEIPAFREGLRCAIMDGHALCVRTGKGADGGGVQGGIIVAPEKNEILWFAVAHASRGKGLGKALLKGALEYLDETRPIFVTTFDRTVAAGEAARKLYQAFGFCDLAAAGANPAGIPTVTMHLIKSHDEQSSQGIEQ